MENKKIILCATQRCGSTMVMEDMRNSEKMGLPEEYFIPWKKGKTVDWAKNLDAIKKKGSSKNGVFAVKIMSNQIFHINACMGEFYDKRRCKSDFLFHYFSDAHWVFIRRRNIIRQSISRYMSRKSGVNHLKSAATGYKPGNMQVGEAVVYKKDVGFDADAIYEEISNIAYENKIWEQKFKKHKIDPTVLYYEEITSKNDTSYLSKILQDAGSSEEIDDVFDLRTLRKMSNNKNEEIFERFLSL